MNVKLAQRVGRLLLGLGLLFALPAWSAEPVAEEAPLPESIMPRYILKDQNGSAVSDQDFRGRFQLIAFGYTYCPDICPTTLAEMSLILGKLGERAARVQPIFITVDPERDTPAVLKNYTSFFDSRILGLTGSPELIRKIADHFRVRYEKFRAPGMASGKYAMDHSAGMFFLGPDGQFLVKFAYASPPAEIAERIGKIMDEPEFNRKRGR